jgi:hypothetical protein
MMIAAYEEKARVKEGAEKYPPKPKAYLSG